MSKSLRFFHCLTLLRIYFIACGAILLKDNSNLSNDVKLIMCFVLSLPSLVLITFDDKLSSFKCHSVVIDSKISMIPFVVKRFYEIFNNFKFFKQFNSLAIIKLPS